MTPVEQLLSQPFMQRLGWALVHFVWQGAVVGLLFALVIFLLRKHGPAARYVAGCVALLLLSFLPPLTMVLLFLEPVNTRLSGCMPLQLMDPRNWLWWRPQSINTSALCNSLTSPSARGRGPESCFPASSMILQRASVGLPAWRQSVKRLQS